MNFFALSSSELGVSTFTVNSIFMISTAIVIALPAYFLFNSQKGDVISKF